MKSERCEDCPDEHTNKCESCGKEVEPMNAIERAVEWVNGLISNFGYEQRRLLVDEALTIKNSLEKQIPKKPTDIKISFHKHSTLLKGMYGKCPMCGTVQADDKYCQHCGQAIDWISTEDKG